MANTIIVATDTTAVPNPLEKMPKKRGRKKGSKGVDSLLAKDTSLSSQMLIQSLSGGNKKVKTTKELYAEMQNRKLGVSTPTTPSHWTSGNSQPVQSQQSRRDSFCSEPSLHSPRTFDACSTNATMSTIATSSTTPDKNAASILRKGFDTSVVDVDSTSDSLISGGMSRSSGVFQESKTKALAAVEQQLVELVHKLPPVQSVEEIEKNCASEIVPCTCKIIEMMPDEPPENAAEQVSAAMGDFLSLDKLKNANSTGEGGEENEMPVLTISVAGNSGAGGGGAGGTGGEGLKVAEPKEPAKPKKSIFDLDFDDEEDPLHTLIAEVAAANAVNVSEDVLIKAENDLSPELKQESAQNQALADPSSSHLPPDPTGSNALVPSEVPAVAPLPLFPAYKVEEDEFCPAKARFELQTQQITGFHINALHNLFIPNVNGNWSDVSASAADDKKQISFKVIDGLNVVPKLSVEDHIRKDLREFSFRRKPKPRSLDVDSNYETPFLGVARCLTKRHRKTRKHRQQTQVDDDQNAGALVAQESKSVEETQAMEVDKETSSSDIKDEVKLHENELPETFSFSVSNQKPTLEAITINVDGINDDSGVVNAVSSAVDSQNLLAIASNIESLTSNETPMPQVKANAADDSFNVQPEITSDELVAFPNISGDILNNNNNSMKFEEDQQQQQSSCESNTSLKQTQNSINQKLRKHRRRRQRRQLELEQSSPNLTTKRKRRRKSAKITPPLKIKCIKIAINGGITTQRHVKMAASSNSGSGGSSSEVNSNDDESCSATGDETDSDDDEKESGLSNHDFNDVEEIDNDDDDMVHVDDDVACGGGDEEYDIEDENGDYADEEDVDGDDYIGEFHEVVTRDISPSTALGNNHIVLTIKKTPSKTNSPASNSPNVVNQLPTTTVAAAETATTTSTTNSIVEAANDDENIPENENAALVSKQSEFVKTQTHGKEIKRHLLPSNLLAAAYAALVKDHNVRRRFKRRRRKRKSQEPPPFRFPDKVCSDGNNKTFNKKHQQLFFPEEIYTQVEVADVSAKRCIFNISSCSSSCNESTEYEYESNSTDDANEMKTKTQRSIKKMEKAAAKCKPPDMFITSSSNDSDTDDDSKENVILEETTTGNNKTLEDLKTETEEEEPEPMSECNNGLLVSFNDICAPTEIDEAKESSSSTLKNENSSPPRTDSKQQLLSADLNPRPEFCTGIRPVSDPTTAVSSDNNSLSNLSSRTQQFKEWHQVLQLRSYNDEPLTVLPYVVLD